VASKELRATQPRFCPRIAEGRAVKDLPSQDFLCSALDYNPKTGALLWRYREDQARAWNNRHANKPAFTALTAEGYRHGRLLYTAYYAHRVIWKMVYGTEPLQVDHINGDRADNRISNLRSVTHQQNGKNQKKRAKSKSGILGVKQFRNGKWIATIGVNGSSKHLGYFADLNDAVAARKKAERELGFHENHGRPR